MRYERLGTIMEILEEVQSINLDTLCERLEVSKNTVRRDIALLEQEGRIKKFYGGIRIATSNEPTPFTIREQSHFEEKKKLAEAAAALVKSGDVIFIDSGTTTMHMVPYLVGKSNVTIVSASLNIMVGAAQYNLSLIGTGGTLYGPSNCFVGSSVLQALSQYNLSHAFMSSSGLSNTGCVTNASPLESEIKKHIMQSSCPKNLLIDNSKFGRSALVTYAHIDQFEKVITDSRPEKMWTDMLEENRVELIMST